MGLKGTAMHGGHCMYYKYKCRCPECRAWARENRRRYRPYSEPRSDPRLEGHDFPHPTWATCPTCEVAS